MPSEAALADLEAWKDVLPKQKDAEDAAVAIYDGWAKRLAKSTQWDEAIAVYEKGLERLPGAGLFKRNRTWCEEQKERP